MPISLPVFETLSIAWAKVKGSKATIWFSFFLIFFLTFIFSMTAYFIGAFFPAVGIILQLFIMILFSIYWFGLIYISIRHVNNEPISYHLLNRVARFSIISKLIITHFLEMLILLIFFFLTTLNLIIPNNSSLTNTFLHLANIVGNVGLIYFSVRLSFSKAFVIDKETMPWRSIVLSFKATRGNFWRLLVLYALGSFIFFVSMLPLFIGLIWTLPYMLILFAQSYKVLLANTEFGALTKR